MFARKEKVHLGKNDKICIRIMIRCMLRMIWIDECYNGSKLRMKKIKKKDCGEILICRTDNIRKIRRVE